MDPRHTVMLDFSVNPPVMRFRRDTLSICFDGFAVCGNRPTDADLTTLLSRLDNVRVQSGGFAPAVGPVSMRLLHSTDFENSDTGAFFKFVPDDTLEWIQKGSFRFGTAGYYRNIEKISSRDTREGFGSILFQGRGRAVFMSLLAGFNAALFCGTAAVDVVQAQRMANKFGSTLVKIEPMSEFIESIKRSTGATRVQVFDVVYSDAPLVVTDYENVGDILASMGQNGQSPMNPSILNERHFETLYDASILPSLLIKPTVYSEEQERRIVIEMPDDISVQVLTVNDKALSEFVHVIPLS